MQFDDIANKHCPQCEQATVSHSTLRMWDIYFTIVIPIEVISLAHVQVKSLQWVLQWQNISGYSLYSNDNVNQFNAIRFGYLFACALMP